MTQRMDEVPEGEYDEYFRICAILDEFEDEKARKDINWYKFCDSLGWTAEDELGMKHGDTV